MLHVYSVVPASVILFFPGISMAKKGHKSFWQKNSGNFFSVTPPCFYIWGLSSLDPNCGLCRDYTFSFHTPLNVFSALRATLGGAGMEETKGRLWSLAGTLCSLCCTDIWGSGVLVLSPCPVCCWDPEPSSGRRWLGGGGSKARLVPWGVKWVLPGWRRARSGVMPVMLCLVGGCHSFLSFLWFCTFALSAQGLWCTNPTRWQLPKYSTTGAPETPSVPWQSRGDSGSSWYPQPCWGTAGILSCPTILP